MDDPSLLLDASLGLPPGSSAVGADLVGQLGGSLVGGGAETGDTNVAVNVGAVEFPAFPGAFNSPASLFGAEGLSGGKVLFIAAAAAVIGVAAIKYRRA